MLAVIGDVLTERTNLVLDQLAVNGLLPEHHRLALAADEARKSLDQLLRTAELAGHNAAHVLHDAVTQGSLDNSRSVAQVLHARIRTTPKTSSPRASTATPTCCPATSLPRIGPAWKSSRRPRVSGGSI